MRKACCLVAVGLLLGAAGPAMAEGGTWPPLGQLAGGGPCGVDVQGEYAFVAATGALTVLDVSTPAQPIQIGYCDAPTYTGVVAVSGQYAYVIDAFAGLRVVDVSDPTAPTELGGYDPGGYFDGLAISGHYAYVTEETAGLHVIDVSDPTAPVEVGSLSCPPGRIAVANHHAYIAGREMGLRVVDVSDPTQPTETGYWDAECYASGVVVSGPYAYVSDAYTGLRTIDVSNPANPAPLGSAEIPGWANDVAVSGDYAYVADADYGGGLWVVDVSEPSAPVVLADLRRQNGAVSLSVSGPYVYVAWDHEGLRVVDVSDPASPTEVGSWDTPDSPYDVVLSGHYAYFADLATGLQVIDTIDPANPVEVGSWHGPGGVRGVAVVGQHAYVTVPQNGLRVIDVSSPEAPFEVGSCGAPGSYGGLAVSGPFAYIADPGLGLRVVDISNPETPYEVGSCDTPVLAGDVALSGHYAYVVDYESGLRVIDISSPEAPFEVGFWDTTDNVHGVAVSGSFAYVVECHALRVLDVSDPGNPTEVGSWFTGNCAYDVAVSGQWAYVAGGSGGLRIIDISDPSDLTEVAYWGMPGVARAVTAGQTQVCVGAERWGILVFREYAAPPQPSLAAGKSPSEQDAHPGDSVDFTLGYGNTGTATAESVELTDVLDPLFSFVGASDEGSYDDGTRTVTWSLGDLAVGPPDSVTLTVEVSEAAPIGTGIPNQAVLSAANAEPVTSNTTIVVVSNAKPDAPTNVSPSHEQPDVSVTPVLEASSFSDPDPSDTFSASHWQIRSASGSYAAPVWDKPDGTATSVAVPSGPLDYSQTYWWHVRYQDNHEEWGDWSEETSFTTEAEAVNNPPSTPANTSPPSGAPDVSLTPTLEASAFSDPDVGDTLGASHWQIRSASGFYSAPVWDKPDGTATSVAVPSGPLDYSQTYWWHVRYQDNHEEWGDWSEETSFTTVAEPPPPPPPPPSLLYPDDGAIISTTTPRLEWSDVSEANSYDLQVDDDPDFSSPTISVTGHPHSDYSTSPGALRVGSSYYWRVRSCNDGTPGAWAAPWSFRVGLGVVNLVVALEHTTDAAGQRWWREAVWARVLDVEGGGSVTRLRVRTPAGAVGEVTPGSAPAGDWQTAGLYATMWWRGELHDTSPQLGSYEITAQNADGLSCVVPSHPTSGAPQTSPTISSPSNGGSVTDTRPTFAWEAPSSSVTTYRVHVSGPPEEHAPDPDVVWERDLPGDRHAVRFNDDGTADVAELSVGNDYGMALWEESDRQVDAGEAGHPEEWHRSVRGREITFVVSGTVGAYVDKLHVVQAPAPGTDLVAGKLTAVRVFVRSLAPEAEGTVEVWLDVLDETGESILDQPRTQPFLAKESYEDTEQDAALFLFPGDGPYDGPSIDEPGHYTAVALVVPEEGVDEDTQVTQQAFVMRSTRQPHVLVHHMRVGYEPAPTEVEYAGMFDLLNRAYPISDGIDVLADTESALGPLYSELDVAIALAFLEGERVLYNLLNDASAPDADYIIGVLPRGTLGRFGWAGISHKQTRAAFVDARPSATQGYVVTAAAAHEIGHITGSPGLGEEYISYTDVGGLRVLDCTHFEWEINEPPLHEDPDSDDDFFFVCQGDPEERRWYLNYEHEEPMGDIVGCYIEAGAYDPAAEEARERPLYAYHSHSIMGLSPVQADSRWATKAVWDYLLSCLEGSAGGSGTRGSGASTAPVLVVSGLLHRDGTAQLRPAYQFASDEPTPSEPDGMCSVELVDGAGQVLGQCDFDVSFGMEHMAPEDVPAAPFHARLAWHGDTARVVLKWWDTPVAELVVSPNAPSVQLLWPNGGEALGETHTISWSAADADGDALYYSLLYSADGGVSWTPLATDLTETAYDWDTTGGAGGTQCLIRVLATDGVNTASDESDATFSVATKAPVASILEPGDGAEMAAGRAVVLTGAAVDAEDGALPSDSLHWISDVDGALGAGGVLRLEGLAAGTHTITLSVTDSDGNPAQDTISLTILADTDRDGMPDQWEEQYDLLDPTVRDATLDSDNDYLRNEDEYLLGSNPEVADSDGGGEPDGLERLAGRDVLDPADDVAQTFGDVAPDFWAWQQVEAAHRLGIVGGYWGGLYHPERGVDRAQMAVYIARALAGGDGAVPRGPGSLSFSDVPADHWAYRHIEYVASQNVAQGYPGGGYQPAAPVTRDQMAVYVARCTVAPHGEEVLSQYVAPSPTFADVPEEHWAYRHIEYCVAGRVVRGYADGLYHPERTVTRDQMAVYVARALKLPM